MLYFCCLADVHPRANDAARSEGVTLYREFYEARKRCNARVAVVDTTRLEPPPEPHACDPLIRVLDVGRDSAVNLDPYLKPRTVAAGGGLVVRAGQSGVDLLLIFRRGVWDLPKGKIDAGESIEAGSVREVREEVGIDDVEVLSYAGTTRHGYERAGRYDVKDTHWYFMRTKADVFTPQREEQIERVEWKPWDEASGLLAFDTLRELVERCRLKAPRG
jgi:8-oxo-dGTP pyrophosphatase MutT (NUDIX family)